MHFPTRENDPSEIMKPAEEECDQSEAARGGGSPGRCRVGRRRPRATRRGAALTPTTGGGGQAMSTVDRASHRGVEAAG
jgi:hypothetical protein